MIQFYQSLSGVFWIMGIGKSVDEKGRTKGKGGKIRASRTFYLTVGHSKI